MYIHRSSCGQTRQLQINAYQVHDFLAGASLACNVRIGILDHPSGLDGFQLKETDYEASREQWRTLYYGRVDWSYNHLLLEPVT